MPVINIPPVTEEVKEIMRILNVSAVGVTVGGRREIELDVFNIHLASNPHFIGSHCNIEVPVSRQMQIGKVTYQFLTPFTMVASAEIFEDVSIADALVVAAKCLSRLRVDVTELMYSSDFQESINAINSIVTEISEEVAREVDVEVSAATNGKFKALSAALVQSAFLSGSRSIHEEIRLVDHRLKALSEIEELVKAKRASLIIKAVTPSSDGAVLESALETSAAKLDALPDYGCEVAENELRITVKDQVVMCKNSTLRGRRNGSPSLPSSLEAGDNEYTYWYVGDVVASMPFCSLTSIAFYVDWHPHIASRGLCKDPALVGNMRRCLARGDLHQLARVVRMFLAPYNPASPYSAITSDQPSFASEEDCVAAHRKGVATHAT